MIAVPVRCVWLATANNPALSNEMSRRVVRIRLDARVERPAEGTGFRHALPEWAMKERGRLIWVALTLGRAWLVAGQPTGTTRVLGSFEEWTRVTGGILAHAGIEGFLANVAEVYAMSDAEGTAIRTLVEHWWDRYTDTEVGVGELWALVSAEDAGIDLDLGPGTDRSQRTRFGKLLIQQRDRQHGAWRIVEGRKLHGAKQWRLEAVNDG